MPRIGHLSTTFTAVRPVVTSPDTDVHDGAVRGWPVWDKLGSGSYVSARYVDLPKATKPALVDQLPTC